MSTLSSVSAIQRQIVLAIRLPRILVAVIAGAGLALVGVVMQALFRNPMADPAIVGVSAGGALGSVLAIASGLAVAQPLALAGAAFAGSLSAAMAVFGFSLRRGRRHIATLLLAGIAFPYLVSSSDAQADNIRFLAYLYGEEARGEPLVREVGDHIARLQAVVGRHPSEQRPSGVILSGGQTVTVAGSGTTEDGVLQLAGGCNAAAEAGIVGNRDISLEALPHMHPDVVIVTEANPDRPSLLPRLRDHPVVGALPVFRDGRVFVVKSSLLSTLSQWNVIGAEQLNRALYPGALP